MIRPIMIWQQVVLELDGRVGQAQASGFWGNDTLVVGGGGGRGELARGVMMDPNHFLPCFPPRLTMLTLPWQLLPLLWSAPRPTPRAPCPLLPMPTIHSPPVVVLPSDHPLSCAPSSYLYCWDPIEIVFDWLISIFKSCIFSITPTLKVDDPMWGCVAERNWTLSQHDQVNNLSPLSSNT